MAVIHSVYQAGLTVVSPLLSPMRNDHFKRATSCLDNPCSVAGSISRRSRQHDVPTMSVCGRGKSKSRRLGSLPPPSCTSSSEADSSSDATSSSTREYYNGFPSPSSPSQRTDIEIVETLHEVEELVISAPSSSDAAISEGLVRNPGLDEDSLAEVLSSASVPELASLSGLSTGSVAGRVMVSQIADMIAEVVDFKEAEEAVEDKGRQGDGADLALAAEGGGNSVEAVQSLPLPETTVKENPTMLQQLRTILDFAGPALGIWLSNPLMSLIDTAVIGNSSSLELAALGKGVGL